MEIGDSVPVIDVHPPHERIHGWRDFFLHLTTITIGLLIALSLEGLVEWHHHRNLAREAQADLHAEIENNATTLQKAIDQVHTAQADLKQDVVVLNYISKHHAAPHHSSITLSFGFHTFDSVSWQTAESTGALAYLPYHEAHGYGDLYIELTELRESQQQAIQDMDPLLGSFANQDGDAVDPTGGQSESLKQSIQVLQGQLIVVESRMTSLADSYKKFLSEHPN